MDNDSGSDSDYQLSESCQEENNLENYSSEESTSENECPGHTSQNELEEEYDQHNIADFLDYRHKNGNNNNNIDSNNSVKIKIANNENVENENSDMNNENETVVSSDNEDDMNSNQHQSNRPKRAKKPIERLAPHVYHMHNE